MSASTTLPPRPPRVDPDLLRGLASAYATLLARQRAASTAFVRWSAPTRRGHGFAWLPAGSESLLRNDLPVRAGLDSPFGQEIAAMRAAVELNPYERELIYGYPFVVGRLDGKPVRAPLLTVGVETRVAGDALEVAPGDEVGRFNTLPYALPGGERAAALERLVAATPALPLADGDLSAFCAQLCRELPVEGGALLDGRLVEPPPEPDEGEWLRLVDCAAVFIAPRHSYFLASDLQAIAAAPPIAVEGTALGTLIGRRGNDPELEPQPSGPAAFPLEANPAQVRAAELCARPDTRLLVIQGPPGTGKSQTIANLVCDLVARGRRVLVTSQKDEALRVVDQRLRALGLPQLPMTLLGADRASREDLRLRLESVQKERSSVETARDLAAREAERAAASKALAASEARLGRALLAEARVAQADEAAEAAAGWWGRLVTGFKLRLALRRARKVAPGSSAALGEEMRAARRAVREAATRYLAVAAEHRVGEASRAQRNQLREFARLLSRSQTSERNYPLFDRLKADPDRCRMLLDLLPCWIMTPDDAARLFPCAPNLFDVVIADEASQCDLPSMTPLLYRARQAVIAGDSRQMQSRRFAFTTEQLARQAWGEQGLDRHDPDRWYDPARTDLLALAAVRFDEEVFLDEHFRSLPPLIAFSNERWYGGRLRLMRDEGARRVGPAEAPVVSLHQVAGGAVEPGTQENPVEAHALIDHLAALLADPAYAGASVGVLCLFEEQMSLMAELVAQRIGEAERVAHRLVVVNPDGFQGDERDVVYYSLSYDDAGMTRSQLSARQADSEHVQGMLNVAFTRARDEIHVFHSAPVEAFAMATGGGSLRDWLAHCAEHAAGPPAERGDGDDFAEQVAQALAGEGLDVQLGHVTAGVAVDVACRIDGSPVALECDGPIATPGAEAELARQPILERAGWRVVRVPYSGWLRDPSAHLQRVLATGQAEAPAPGPQPLVAAAPAGAPRLPRYEQAVVDACNEGLHARDDVYRSALRHAGHKRIGSRIRVALDGAVRSLERSGKLYVEDGELFVAAELRGESPSQRDAQP